MNSLYKRVMQLTFTDVTLILVTNSYIDSTIDLSKDISKKIPYKSNVDLKIWDQHKIEQLAYLYPIDFSNAKNIDISSRTSENDIKISENDFELKNGNALRSVRNIIKHRHCSYRADRSGVWRLQVCLRCIRNISYWTSRQRD